MSIFFILNVLYPYLLFGFIFFIVQTILKKNKLLLTINLTVFLFIFFLLGPIYVFGDSNSKKQEDGLKVLTLNAHRLDGY